METSRRGNYDSGEDFVLEYGELRFTFNEDDFSERCEQAALKLGFVGGRLGEEESEDLVNLAVNGEILDPASALGEHVNDCWPELVGPAERSLVHWLRRLVFRGAWLDQRVNEGELSVAFDEETGSFAYVQPVGRAGIIRRRRADRTCARAFVGPRRLPPLGIFGDHQAQRALQALLGAQMAVLGVPGAGVQRAGESVDDALLHARLEQRPH